MSIQPTSPLQRAALHGSVTGVSPRQMALSLKSNLSPKSGVLKVTPLITGKTLVSIMGAMRPSHSMQPNSIGISRSYSKLLGSNIDLFG